MKDGGFTVVNKDLPYTIAVDFDGTLVEDKFPEIGEPYPLVFELMQHARDKGAKIILWTCRSGANLAKAIAFCSHEFNWVFDAVNRNLPESIIAFGGDSRKIHADEYWDDKSVCFNFNPEEDEV